MHNESQSPPVGRAALQRPECMSAWAARRQGIVPARAGVRNWGRVVQSVPVERAGELRNAS
jgi:hypothetical protein